MSSNRPQQSAAGASPVPSTSSSSSSSTGGTGNTNGGGGSSTPTSNGNTSGNLVPSRNLAAVGEGGLSVPNLAAVPSPRGGFGSLSRPSASSGRRRSLHQAPLYNGLLNSYEDKSNDFVWLVFAGVRVGSVIFGNCIFCLKR